MTRKVEQLVNNPQQLQFNYVNSGTLSIIAYILARDFSFGECIRIIIYMDTPIYNTIN